MTPVDGSIIVAAANMATSQVSAVSVGSAAGSSTAPQAASALAGLDVSAVDLLLAAEYQEAAPALAGAIRAPSNADLPVSMQAVGVGDEQSAKLIDSQAVGAAIQGLDSVNLGAARMT